MKNVIYIFVLFITGAAFVGFLTIIIVGCNDDDDKNRKILLLLLMNNCTASQNKRIFVTNSSYTGNLGGIAGADQKCMNDLNKPAVSCVWKALIVGDARSITRDWVLKPNTTYYRVDGTTPLGATEAGGKLLTPLYNSIIAVNSTTWTGLNPVWTSDTNTCTNWTSAVNSLQPVYLGVTDRTDSGVISAAQGNCDGVNRLYCVEQ
jgi:hypothetical protein